MKYIGVDIGGTKTDVVLIDETGKIYFQKKFETSQNKKELIDSITKVIFEFSHNDVGGIGIGVPGVLNKKMTRVETVPHITSLNNANLKQIFEKKTNLPVKLENDVNCMTLYSLIFGHGKKVNNFVCVTLGTGVGGGIILDKKLYRGRGNAAEWGHMTLAIDKKEDGEFESFVARKGVRNEMKRGGFGKKVSFIELEKRMLKGEKKAKDVVRNIGIKLGVGLSTIILHFDPELIVIGGGFAHYGETMLKAARKEAQRRTFFEIPPIKLIKNISHAGAIGAASLFLADE